MKTKAAGKAQSAFWKRKTKFVVNPITAYITTHGDRSVGIQPHTYTVTGLDKNYLEDRCTRRWVAEQLRIYSKKSVMMVSRSASVTNAPIAAVNW